MSDYSNVHPISPSVVVNSDVSPQSVHEDDPSRELALTIAQAADDRKGGNITIMRVSDVSYLTDYFVVVTGFSNVQVNAIARSIEDEVLEKWNRYPLQVEGRAEGSWVLLDYGDVIAHIFMPEEREFYNLEAFWGHADRIDFSPAQPAQGEGRRSFT